MALNLLKLCVGVESVEDLQEWIDRRQAERRASGQPAEQYHTTRMTPKRSSELLAGGSLYWVIKGQIQARQRLMDLRPVTGEDGIARCRLVLAPHLQRTQWQRRKAFQGWRYLEATDAPADDAFGEDASAIPVRLRNELSELGLL